jgi:hypothetical protein
LHVLRPPAGNELRLPPPADGARFNSALMLRSGRRAGLAQDGSGLRITVPEPWEEWYTVIKLGRK